MSNVPAATRCLQVLRFLGRQPEPVPIDAIARAVGLPRSSAYHLIKAMIAEGFVTHIADERRYALGVAAFEVGTGYARQEPLQRIVRRPLRALVDQCEQSGHFAVLHGRDVYYVLEERALRRPSLVTDEGVRLPAHLTASGRAILAELSRQQVRALFSSRADFVARGHGSGPTSLSALTSVLAQTRQRGHATEHGDVTPGMSSVAKAVLDHTGHPVGAVAVTYESSSLTTATSEAIASSVVSTAQRLSHRLGHRSRAEGTHRDN